MEQETPLRTGFIIGSRSWARLQGLRAKRAKMRIERLVYPDIYYIAHYLSPDFDFIRDGTRLEPDRYDVIFSELNRSIEQLEYLKSVIDARVARVVVLPGPPDLLTLRLTEAMNQLVRAILRDADHVWTYADSLAHFCNGLIGLSKARTIPFPFDLDATRRLARSTQGSESPKLRVLVNLPVRFSGVQQNYPFLLKALFQDALARLAPRERDRFRFATMVYTLEDRRAYHASGFASGWPISLLRKRGYVAFARTVGRAQAVVNFTADHALGRLTFLAGAMGIPGIFSDNVELNNALYPGSVRSPLRADRLREDIFQLVDGLVEGRVDERFYPVEAELALQGDFASNRRFAQALLRGNQPVFVGP